MMEIARRQRRLDAEIHDEMAQECDDAADSKLLELRSSAMAPATVQDQDQANSSRPLRAML